MTNHKESTGHLNACICKECMKANEHFEAMNASYTAKVLLMSTGLEITGTDNTTENAIRKALTIFSRISDLEYNEKDFTTKVKPGQPYWYNGIYVRVTHN